MNRYPLVEELPSPGTALQVFEVIKDRPYSFFLDSGMDPRRLGRYSFLGADPFLIMSSRGTEITLTYGEKREVHQGNPFDFLGDLLERYRLDHSPAPVPFVGGAVGYFGYDLCHFIEQLPGRAIDDLKLPECYFAFYDTVLAFDQLKTRAYAIATGFPEIEDSRRLRQARARLEEVKSWLDADFPPVAGNPERFEEGQCSGAASASGVSGGGELRLRSNFTPQEYIKAVEKVRNYIACGDVFQVNLSQRFEVDLRTDPYQLYKRLRTVNPAPFASYLNFPEVIVASASPERFLKVEGDLVETRPIKGTRPRGKEPVEDGRLAWELRHSAKDRAENVMIVDLERNDLGRVCRYGTVKVTELAILETFPTVFHLTSTVVGRLRRGKTNIDLLKATFPGGSITGAPKVRAMEIIDELEPTRRSIYTGSIGYLGFNEDMDINIVIRTFLIKGGKAYFQVGGGIIYDSDPEAEYVETLDKARALVEALKLASRVAVETG